MPVFELLLEAGFCAAHRLRMYDGSFEPLHGHNWRVEVFLEGTRLDEIGVVADFTVLQRRLSDVVAELHDTYLNDLPAFASVNPSAECVAQYLYGRLAALLEPEVKLTKVRVWETPGCAAAYLPGRPADHH
jgi:6-pyruvoyltetrahydropterin/6-carboxytetrahydropterin synthase